MSNSTVFGRFFYRLLRHPHPTRQDFVSNAARGRYLQPTADAETRRLWDGLSLYETSAQARATASRFKGVWQAIAAVAIPGDGRFRLERTTESAGHWTVWGDADALVQCVVEVEVI